MEAGTIIELPDGRRGTVVYNGLDGEGIAWGEIELQSDFMEEAPQAWAAENFGRFNRRDYPAVPICEALLRKPFKYQDMECVGTEFKIISEPPK